MRTLGQVDQIGGHSEEPTKARQAQILRELHQTAWVSVDQLSRSLGVSAASVRRDLAALESQGLLRRTHGGAQPVGSLLYEPFRYDSSFKEQELRYADEKRRIGSAAADLVREGDTIGLTAGTTTTQLARALRHRRRITIVTNTVNVAMELADRVDLSVFVTGGLLRGGWFSLVGPVGLEAARTLFLDAVFIGVNGIDAEQGLTCHVPDEAAINRTLVRQARVRVAVADRSKLGVVTTSRICDIEDVHVLITDRDAPEASTAPFLAKGIDVRRA